MEGGRGGGHIDSVINLLFFLKVLMFYTELIYRPSYQEKTDAPLIQKSPFFTITTHVFIKELV